MPVSSVPPTLSPSGVADLIVANISPAWIAELAADWARILKQDGIGVLSGFEAGDVARVSKALEAASARVISEYGEREWRMLEITRAQGQGYN